MHERSLREQIFNIISSLEPVTATEIKDSLKKKGLVVEREKINSVLYGELRDVVMRDVNEKGVPAWRVRRKRFAAAGGLETKFFNELVKKKVIAAESAQLGFSVKNTRNGKTYHLDIAIFLPEHKRYNIEIDGFDHVRADALSSIERQITEEGPNTDIEIDWMDNEKSYIAYNEINTKKVYAWLGDHINWCVRYHEELLWPKDITRNVWLIEKGWKIIRFWNTQITDDLQGCVREVHEFLQEKEKK